MTSGDPRGDLYGDLVNWNHGSDGVWRGGAGRGGTLGKLSAVGKLLWGDSCSVEAGLVRGPGLVLTVRGLVKCSGRFIQWKH